MPPSSLPVITDLLSGGRIRSISGSYFDTGTISTVFVGSLFAIAAFLVAYNGRTRDQMFWRKVAAIAAALIALCPRNCNGDGSKGLGVHYAAATVMFGVLTYFCWAFYGRSFESRDPQSKARRAIYLASGLVMVLASLAAQAGPGQPAGLSGWRAVRSGTSGRP